MSKFCKKEVCGTCRYNKLDDWQFKEWICDNPESDNYTDEVEYNDKCTDWEER